MIKTLTKEQTGNIAENIKRNLNEDMQVSVIIRNKIEKVPDFVMVFQEVAKRIVTSKELSPATYRVLFFIIGIMDFQNYIGICIETIAEDLQLSIPSVKRAMKQLKELNIIISIKDGWDKRKNSYMLNPLAAWKGKVRNRTSVIKKMKNLENPGQLRLNFK